MSFPLMMLVGLFVAGLGISNVIGPFLLPAAVGVSPIPHETSGGRWKRGRRPAISPGDFIGLFSQLDKNRIRSPAPPPDGRGMLQ